MELKYTANLSDEVCESMLKEVLKKRTNVFKKFIGKDYGVQICDNCVNVVSEDDSRQCDCGVYCENCMCNDSELELAFSNFSMCDKCIKKYKFICYGCDHVFSLQNLKMLHCPKCNHDDIGVEDE